MYIHPPWLHGAHMSGKCWMYVGHFVFMDIDAHQSLQEDGLVLRGSAWFGPFTFHPRLLQPMLTISYKV